MMPRLQQVLHQAAVGDLTMSRPRVAASLWTSIATGLRPTRHGVFCQVQPSPCLTRIVPTLRSTCQARPAWALLSDAGYRAHAYGWPATHPAERINGVIVSDRYADPDYENSVSPPELLPLMSSLRLAASDIDAASLKALLPRAAELDPAADSRLFLIAEFLSRTATFHAAATWALEHESWDFAAVRYAELARLIRTFGRAYAASQSGAATGDDELFSEVVPNACQFFDMLLGRLLDLAGPEASLMLVSTSRATTAAPSGDARTPGPAPGLFIAAGPTFRSSQLNEVDVCDIAPTIFRAFQLPETPSLQGRALEEVLRDDSPGLSGRSTQHAARQTPATASSPRSARPAAMSEADATTPSSAAESPGEVDHLLALGYLEQPDPYLHIAIEELGRSRQWREAEAWIDSGQLPQAASILEKLVAAAPQDSLYRATLAAVYFQLDRLADCRRLIQSLQSDGLDLPLASIGLAALDSLEGSVDSAVEHLHRAESSAAASAPLLEMMGHVYLALRRRNDAARAFAAAIAAEPARATAHAGLAATAYLSGDFQTAERHAREVIGRNPRSFEAHCQLGVALRRLNRSREAIDVLRKAVSLHPQGAGKAHRHLAALYDEQGQGAFAAHHRALASRDAREHRPRFFDLEWITDALA